MPGLQVNNYRFGYQGEYAEDETEEKTKANTFQLRLYDARIGRWLTTDPYGQYHSPYLAMGNNPASMVDPDGGYSKFGAWWRNGFSMKGVSYNESIGEYGFNNSGEGMWQFADDPSNNQFIHGQQAFVYPGFELQSFPINTVSQERINFSLKQLSSSHGDNSNDINYFTLFNRNKTHDEVINQKSNRGSKLFKTQIGGPSIRYIKDPLNPLAIIDMRHMLVVGSYSPFTGNGLETFQAISGQKSGGDFQDAYSNYLGYQFFKKYSTKLESNPTKFSFYLKEFLYSKHTKRLHPNMSFQSPLYKSN